MKPGRFETFADAIIAIVVTILILKIPQPAEPTLTAIWNLRIMYIAYIISFLILFNAWYSNHNLFQLVENIDNLTIWLTGALLFVFSLLPYFTIWLARNVNSIPAETMFGLIFISAAILSNLSVYTLFRSDPYNKKLEVYENANKWMIIPLIFQIIGFIITYTMFAQGIYMMCFVSMIIWIIFARRDRIKCDEI